MKDNRKEKRERLPLFGIPRLFPFARPYKKQFLGLVLAQVLCSISDVARSLLWITLSGGGPYRAWCPLPWAIRCSSY